MKKYHKIQSIYKRDEKNRFIIGKYSCPEFEFLKDNQWHWTEKIDGTNIRIMWNGKDIKIAGKSDNASIPIFLEDKLNEIFQNKKMIEKFKDVFSRQEESEEISVCLYGEGYGARINKGGSYIPDGVDFILFDIQIGYIWLRRETVVELAEKLGLKCVPDAGSGTLDQAIEYTKKGFNSALNDCLAEGLVLRPLVELQSRIGHRVISKIKHKDFK